MRFKDGAIKRNTIIHCPTRDDAIALQKRLEEMGCKYVGWMAKNYCHFGENTCYYIKKDGMLEHQSVEFYVKANCGDRIVEFSDLIEPEMSAIEVLEWIKKNYWNYSAMSKTFGLNLGIAELVGRFGAQGVIDRIIAYEAAKKVPKPVEVEYGWECKVIEHANVVKEYELWNCDKGTAENNVISKAAEWTKNTGEQTLTMIRATCRVKGGKSDE